MARGKGRDKPYEGQLIVVFPVNMMNSEAYKALSPDGVWALNEMEKKFIYAKYGRQKKNKNVNRLKLCYAEFNDRITEYLFYKGRREIVDFGFYEQVEQGGTGHKPSIFKKSVNWKSISLIIKDKKDREAQSQRDKKREQEQKEQERDSILTTDDYDDINDLLDDVFGKDEDKK